MVTGPTLHAGVVDVHVIGKCSTKGCMNRRRNILEGRVRSDRLRTWTAWAIPTALGPVSPHQGLAWSSVSETVAYAMQYGDPRDLDPDGAKWPGPAPAQINIAIAIVAKAEAMYALGWVCEDHDRFMTLAAVQGVVNIDRGCDGRCEAATGQNCSCSCGGRNHGAAYDWTGR